MHTHAVIYLYLMCVYVCIYVSVEAEVAHQPPHIAIIVIYQRSLVFIFSLFLSLCTLYVVSLRFVCWLLSFEFPLHFFIQIHSLARLALFMNHLIVYFLLSYAYYALILKQQQTTTEMLYLCFLFLHSCIYIGTHRIYYYYYYCIFCICTLVS